MASRILLVGVLTVIGAYIIISMLAPYVAVAFGIFIAIKYGPMLVGPPKRKPKRLGTNIVIKK